MDTWQFSSALLAVFSVILVALVATRCRADLQHHYFFLLFLALTVGYLQVGPALSLASPGRPLSLEVIGFDAASRYREDYVRLQVWALAGFLLPMVLAYLVRPPWRPPVSIGVQHRRANALAIGCAGFAVMFLLLAWRHDVLFMRVGSEEIARRIVALPRVPYFVIRSFQENAVFLVAVLAFAAGWTRPHSRAAVWLGLAVTTACFGGFALLNSRLQLVSMIVVLVGVNLYFVPPALVRRMTALMPRLLLVLVVAGYLATVVINVRNLGYEGSFRLAYLNPLTASPFSDSQGVYRLNCIDLLARMVPAIDREGPALGAAWQSTTWLVWRFIDPDGFDQFRLSANTTAKWYLMERYLGSPPVDYFSCTATDLFGNFHVVGFLGGGLLLGFVFAHARRTLLVPLRGSAIVLALFVLTHAIVFDQEAAALLFGWLRKVPVLLAVLALQPFTVLAASGTPRGR